MDDVKCRQETITPGTVSVPEMRKNGTENEIDERYKVNRIDFLGYSHPLLVRNISGSL